MSDLHVPTPEERAAFDALPAGNLTVAALIRVASLGDDGERLANREVVTPGARRLAFARWLHEHDRLAG